MVAKIVGGVAVSSVNRAEIKCRVSKLTERGVTPGLAVIIVDTDPASAVYVRNKIKACTEVGIRSFRYDFAVDSPPEAVLQAIRELNHRNDIHGILVQLPLPPHFLISQMLWTISVDKDVDSISITSAVSLLATQYFLHVRLMA
jgi:methylenetetrahydrofolate dehydrogenase (NADP+)/methenyltetrahydrofolate cyclohydrolase